MDLDHDYISDIDEFEEVRTSKKRPRDSLGLTAVPTAPTNVSPPKKKKKNKGKDRQPPETPTPSSQSSTTFLSKSALRKQQALNPQIGLSPNAATAGSASARKCFPFL
jgi:hypothetical protein